MALEAAVLVALEVLAILFFLQAAFKVPVEVRFFTETLPRNANGKILKSELKKLFESEPA